MPGRPPRRSGIWASQRDSAVLIAGLDDTDAALVQRVLALLSVQG